MTNKDLISQYVDTGLKLPEYQVSKLSNNDKRTYIRKRLIKLDMYQEDWMEDDELESYEAKLLSQPQKKKYLDDYLDKTILEYGDEIDFDTMEMIAEFPDLVDRLIKMGYNFSKEELLLLPIKNRNKFLTNAINNGDNLYEDLFSILSEKQKIKYLYKRMSVDNDLDDFEIAYIPRIPFDDTTVNNSIIFYILQLGDKGVKLLLERLTTKKIKYIFGNIERWTDETLLGPIGKKLAIKYGGIEDDRPTFKEVYDEIVSEFAYYGEDKLNQGKYIEIDEVEEPLPQWVINKGGKEGVFYHDSTDGFIFGLTLEEALEIAKSRIPKIFKIKRK